MRSLLVVMGIMDTRLMIEVRTCVTRYNHRSFGQSVKTTEFSVHNLQRISLKDAVPVFFARNRVSCLCSPSTESEAVFRNIGLFNVHIRHGLSPSRFAGFWPTRSAPHWSSPCKQESSPLSYGTSFEYKFTLQPIPSTEVIIPL